MACLGGPHQRWRVYVAELSPCFTGCGGNEQRKVLLAESAAECEGESVAEGSTERLVSEALNLQTACFVSLLFGFFAFVSSVGGSRTQLLFLYNVYTYTAMEQAKRNSDTKSLWTESPTDSERRVGNTATGSQACL